MRESGVLLPITALPSKYGIGCFDEEAYKFVDHLKQAKQSIWQILPLGITGYGDSPYQSFSTFAGNPYFISLDALVKKGWLSQEDLPEAPARAPRSPAGAPQQADRRRCPGHPRGRQRQSP